MNKRLGAYIKLVTAMLIFGSIGAFVRYIPLPSSIVAFFRAFIGIAFLGVIFLTKSTKLSASAIKKNGLWLLLSGAAIGFNWILLFESYRYTSVAVATLCYYMAPVIVTLLSPFILKEKLNTKHILCIFLALIGMIFISGVFNPESITEYTMQGVALSLGAAVLYASVILLNKQLRDIEANDRTVCQLGICAVILIPYNLLTCDLAKLTVTPVAIILLLIVGIIHTGFAYSMYFASIGSLKAQSVAIASYIDPVVAVLVSVLLLREPYNIYTAMGTIAILISAVISELPTKKGLNHDN